MLDENILFKWAHRFGIDSLNDLIINSSVPKENQHEQENQEKTKLELSKTFEKYRRMKLELNFLETFSINGIFSKDQNYNDIKEFLIPRDYHCLSIKNLGRWINNDKKAS